MKPKRTIDVAGPELAKLLFGWDGPMWRYRNPWGPWVKGEPPEALNALPRYGPPWRPLYQGEPPSALETNLEGSQDD